MYLKYFLIGALAFVSLSACGDSKKDQARALLGGLRAIDIKTPYDQRKVAIAALKMVELSDDDLVRIRQECLHSHQALIQSEEQQAAARKILNSATGGETKSAIAADKALLMTAALEKSNSNLQVAMKSFPSCEREIRSLELRFGK
jgi:hypothetical protein